MKRITFVCLNAGNYCGRGAEYVNILYDSIVRVLPGGLRFRFACLTDNPEGLNHEIEVIPLPSRLEGWYGKLYLFNSGVFPIGERVIFFDLDTVILGRIDDLLKYEGEFATLTDFYEPARVGPAVISWKAGGKASRIWTEWIAAGEPRLAMGDLEWINGLDEGRFVAGVDRIQELVPGAFVSYKRDCTKGGIPPKGTRVVCFHGIPRPHEADDLWVRMAWKIDGMSPADLDFVINTERERVTENIRAACALPLPWLEFVPPHDGEAIIVGGGPSLAMMLEELRERASAGGTVYAVNGAHEYLIERGIVPDWHVIIDARVENADFIQTPAAGYLLASQCAPETFRRAAASPVTVFHMNTEGVMDAIPSTIKPINLISSGNTVGLAALAAAYCMGFRSLYIYGMDSSYEDTRHAYPQSLNDNDGTLEAEAGGRKFTCAPWMVEQVNNFQVLANQLAEDGCEIHVRSFGLLGHVAWLMAHEVTDATA